MPNESKFVSQISREFVGSNDGTICFLFLITLASGTVTASLFDSQHKRSNVVLTDTLRSIFLVETLIHQNLSLLAIRETGKPKLVKMSVVDNAGYEVTLW
jgi:hypothetical protein